MTSNTGLMASTSKSIQSKYKPPVELSCMIAPAPYILRPFAGLYNPFSYGCSILCNHPADSEIKDVVKRAKDTLTSDYNKIDSTIQEMINIRATLHKENQIIHDSTVDFVPEELFRRYTETDSRPLTPAPTLASAVSKGSMRRRCLTPDQPSVTKKTLILDLRRSHSQETLYWHGAYYTSDDIVESNITHTKKPHNSDNKDIPLVSPVTFSMRSTANANHRGNISDRGLRTKNKGSTTLKPKTIIPPHEDLTQQCVHDGDDDDDDETEIEVRELVGGEMRRRGRRKKGRNRLMSAALINTVQHDPETQIAGIGSESHNASSRGSIVQHEEDLSDVLHTLSAESQPKKSVMESFLEPDILKYLHRDIESSAIEVEFDPQRRCVLQEALRTRPDKTHGKEMQTLIKEWLLPPVSLEKWLHLPRVFSRRNALFSLPIDRRQLEGLTPMKYLSNYVKVSSNKQLLYQTIVNKFSPDSFYINIENIRQGLSMMMGETCNETILENFHSIILWEQITPLQIATLTINQYQSILIHDDVNINVPILTETLSEDFLDEFKPEKQITIKTAEDKLKIHFRTWCGLCALCERLYAPLSSPASDPAHEVELADFDTLNAKLMTVNIDENMSIILSGILNSHSCERIDNTHFIFD